MLRVEPVRGVGRIRDTLQGEITLIAQMPEDVARARTIGIVDFDQPVLVADGNDQIAVVGGVDHGVGVGPIGKQIGPAVGVEMVEFIPEPHGVVILVEIDDRVAGHGHAGDNLLESGNDDEMAVGQKLKVVVGSDNGDVATGAGGGGQGGVEVSSPHLPDELSGEVHLLQDGIEPVGGRCAAEIDEEMAIRKQLDGVGGDEAV